MTPVVEHEDDLESEILQSSAVYHEPLSLK